MSYTNTTSHYSLPQYVGSDKPKYLTDFNTAMATIDGQMYDNATAASTADSKADAAQSTADANTSSISALDSQINGAAGLAADVAANQGAITTINSLIGNGTPTTTDKTIIGAINELHGDITGAQVKINEDVEVASIQADGVKTFQELMTEALAALNTYISSATNKVVPTHVNIESVGKAPVSSIQYSGTTITNLQASKTQATNTGINTFAYRLTATDANNLAMIMDTNTSGVSTVTDRSQTVLGNSYKIIITADIYKIIA